MTTTNSCKRISLAQAQDRLPGPESELSFTVFDNDSLVVKIYVPSGQEDQTPHSRDEIYVIARGSGEFVCGGARQAFVPPDVLFAAAGVEHRFENFTDDFAVWVFFYGPEGGEVDQD